MSTPIGPYTPIVRAGDFLVISGQLGLVNGEMIVGGVTHETTQALTNMAALLEGEGTAIVEVIHASTDAPRLTCRRRKDHRLPSPYARFRPHERGLHGGVW